MATTSRHWLDLWASNLHDWQTMQHGNETVYYRRLGIVENMFDVDGTDFEGRADINARLSIEIQTSLGGAGVRDHITRGKEFLDHSTGDCWLERYFHYSVPRDESSILDDGRSSIVFLEDEYPDVNPDHFYVHGMNCSRTLDEKQYLAKLFVFPFVYSPNGSVSFQAYLVAAHQIADGLTIYRWTADLVRSLNYTTEQLGQEAKVLCSRNATVERLPPAQESLYPSAKGNRARVRWKWVISRLLRHVQVPVPASFQNPLRRDQPSTHATELPHTYSKVLDYSRTPPLNSYTVALDISERATYNLIRLCQQAGISRGSGSFVLVALVMMRLEERYRPNIALSDRLPFVGSFPVNPRPFLAGASTTGKEDSIMLAFSDGVTLPFLPSSCDLQTSFRVLGRLAHRQLNQYQKKKKESEQRAQLHSRSPQELLPSLYLTTIERVEGKVQSYKRAGLTPQGGYPAKQGGSLATCGISSIGDVSGLIPKDTHRANEGDERAVVANLRDLKSAVRARDGEFLVGSAGSKTFQGFLVSYDGSAMDPGKVLEWKNLLLSILDYDMFTDVTYKHQPPRL